MNQREFNSVRRNATAAEREILAAHKASADRDQNRIAAEALIYKAELDALCDAMQSLKQARLAAGVTLAEVGRRTGIDRGRLSALENDRTANPTLATLTRIAEAIGVKLKVMAATEQGG